MDYTKSVQDIIYTCRQNHVDTMINIIISLNHIVCVSEQIVPSEIICTVWHTITSKSKPSYILNVYRKSTLQ